MERNKKLIIKVLFYEMCLWRIIWARICGGDKAMRSLGNSVGSIGASICNFLEYFGQMAQNSPTAYG